MSSTPAGDDMQEHGGGEFRDEALDIGGSDGEEHSDPEAEKAEGDVGDQLRACIPRRSR